MFINNYIFFHRQVQDYARELAAQGSGAVVFDVIPTSDYLFRHTHTHHTPHTHTLPHPEHALLRPTGARRRRAVRGGW